MRKSAQSASPWESNTLHCIMPNIHFFPERFFSSVITQRYIHLCSWQTTRITCLVTQGHLMGNCFMEVCHLTFMFLVRSISKKQQPFCKKRLILEITPSACAEYLVTANIRNEGIMLSNTGCISLPLTRRDISKKLTERAGGDDGKIGPCMCFSFSNTLRSFFGSFVDVWSSCVGLTGGREEAEAKEVLFPLIKVRVYLGLCQSLHQSYPQIHQPSSLSPQKCENRLSENDRRE